MEFKLDPYRRNIPEVTLLKDLVEVCKRLGKESIGEKEYDANGQYSSGTFRKRFGSWSAALEKVGRKAFKWHNVTMEGYVEDIKRVARLLGKGAVTMAEYDDLGKYSSSAVVGKLGSWFAALEAAGLEKTRNLGITDEEYFSNLERVWRTLGRQPIGTDMRKPLSSYLVDGYSDRFGTWRKALEAFVEYVTRESIAPPQTEGKAEEMMDIVSQPDLPSKVTKRSRNVSWRLRFLVMRRDGFRCCNCGRSPATERGVILHIDHTKAWSKDGPNSYDNLQTLCSVCNIGKSNLENG